MPEDNSYCYPVSFQPGNKISLHQKIKTQRTTVQTTLGMRKKLEKHMAYDTTNYRPQGNTRNGNLLQQTKPETGRTAKQATRQEQNQRTENRTSIL